MARLSSATIADDFSRPTNTFNPAPIFVISASTWPGCMRSAAIPSFWQCASAAERAIVSPR